ncbi:hypothetical protein HMPREF1008_01050 [Olsenella sp. oral taxon 809 str. F0356]|uniref:biotin transporter BioY n=1 Tax=Olsenella sp. oral taxon 809 TaxID=661086 RepID=UPI000231EDE3|nr:biotin transporter BioY [Olsenella sp. oral taxon 809]EHF01955.1 hypothetical protein HMPREF1008_01050 [Olsenella sp. oral taxon 809 str. F0356]
MGKAKGAPRRLENRDLARVATFAALIAVGGWTSVPVGPVPITLQTFAVMLAGIVLGPCLAPLSVVVLLLLAAIGLPVLHGGAGGLALFMGPTVGYLVGFVAGSCACGLIAQSGGRVTPVRTFVACLVGGVAVPYLFGIPGTALVLGQGIPQTALSALVFVPGDLVKAVLATTVACVLWRAYPAAWSDSLGTSRVARDGDVG